MGRNASVIIGKEDAAKLRSQEKQELGLLKDQAARIKADIDALVEKQKVYAKNLKEVEKRIKQLSK